MKTKHNLQVFSGLLTSSYLNFLLVAVPFGIVFGQLEANPTLVFTLNIVGLIPLALLLGNITEILADKFGTVWGGLLNATFGNLVEIILAIQAVRKDLFVVVETSLLGSILSNLLLVAGSCFFFGGMKYKIQKINSVGSSSLGTLLMLASIAMLMPTSMRLMDTTGKDQAKVDEEILNASHYVAIVLIIVYICNLIFSLHTHAYLYEIPEDEDDTQEIQARQQTSSGVEEANAPKNAEAPSNSINSNNNNNYNSSSMNKQVSQDGPQRPGVIRTVSGAVISKSFFSGQSNSYQEIAREAEEGVSTAFCVVILIVITLIISLMSEYITGSVEAVSEQTGLNQSFIGLVLLPIAGNACEHITAIIVAMKDKMDLAMQVALGSSLQIALFAIPVTVIYGWISGHHFSLSFDPFTVILVIVSMIHANFIVSDAKSHWLEGIQLISVYVLIALAFLFMN